MPDWPSSLPQDVLVRGFTETYTDNVVLAPVDFGVPKRRPKFTAAGITMSINIHVTEAERSTLDSFFHVTLVDGENSFTWIEPINQTTKTLEFVEPPKYTPVGADLYANLKLMEVV